MSDREPTIVPVTDENHEDHRRRWQRHRLRKAFLKAKDRRRNFEKGEYAGFLYCLGLGALWVAASGEVTYVQLDTWHRVGYVFAGVLSLGAKTTIKRFFWGQTEDAEYKDEDDDYGREREPIEERPVGGDAA